MLALVVTAALVVQTVVGAPQLCGDLCDDQAAENYGNSKNSYSSYRSGYSQHLSRRSGLGGTGSRIENFDDNVIGTSGLDRPGNWHDEKHYVTDDGKGEMSYRAGQTVTNNGYSKYAQHSYSYGTHDTHAPQSNSQVLSTAEFERELQSMRNRISSFMGNFHLGAGTTMNANLLQEFKNKASLISSQLNNVCNQVDVGSSMYQQMQEMMQQFQHDVDMKQREMESLIYESSSSISSQVHGSSSSRYNDKQTTHYAPIETYPTRPAGDTYTLEQKRIEEEYSKIQAQINNFYSTFNRLDANLQYQQDLNSQIKALTQKLETLKFESIQYEAIRTRVETLKRNFENYAKQICTRIEEIERRSREEETKRKELELQAEQEKLRIEEEEKLRLEQLEEERIRQQQLEEERIRQQHLEEERKRQQQLEEERKRQQQLEEERLHVLEQQRIRLEEQRAAELREEQRLREVQREEARLKEEVRLREETRLREEKLQLEERNRRLLQQMQPKQQASSSLEYESKISSNYEARVHGGSGNIGSYAQKQQQPTIQPHVDLTAAMNRLQQDLNRLQTEVNNFNMYKIRLTSTNSASVVSEAEKQAELLRERLKNLCETSSRYQNVNIQTSAEDLMRRFESLFNSFQSQAANYSAQSESSFSASGGHESQSSYGATGSYSTVQAPSITNVEYEHSKSTDIEVSRRPAAVKHYASGSSYSASSGYASGSYANKGGSAKQVECVETYAGQPCVQQTRYRRDVGEYEPFFNYHTSDNTHHSVLEDLFIDNKNKGLEQQYAEPQIFSDSLSRENLRMLEHKNLEKLLPRPRPIKQQHDSRSFKNQDLAQEIQRAVPLGSNLFHTDRNMDLIQEKEQYDDYHKSEDLTDQHNSPIASENVAWKQQFRNLPQPVNFGYNKKSELFQKSRNQYVDITGNLEKQSDLNNYNLRESEILNPKSKPQSVKPKSQNIRSEEKVEQLQVRPTLVIEKMNSNEESENFNLEKSGFNDYSEENEKSKTTENSQQLQLITANENIGLDRQPKNLTLQKSFNDTLDNGGRVSNKSLTSDQKSKEFTLQNSGFYNYPKGSKQSELSQNTAMHVLNPFGNEKIQESENLTLQNRRLISGSSQSIHPDLSDRSVQVWPLAIGEEQLSQKAENFVQQSRQIDIDLDSRNYESSLQGYLKPEEIEVSSDKISHPIEKTTDKLHHSYLQSSQNTALVNSDYSNLQLENFSNKTDGSPAYLEHEELIPTVRPIVKPAPKPSPRYTRPWQISQFHNVPKQLESEKEQTEKENTSTEISANSQDVNRHIDFNNHFTPLRGDIQGNSEPSTTLLIINEPSTTPYIEPPRTPLVVDMPSNNNYQKPNLDYNSNQQHEQVDLFEDNQSQKSRNEWQQNNKKEFGHSNQDYQFNQQSFSHNYKYSQQSNHYNHNSRSYVENSNIQLNHQLKPTEFGQEQEPIYQFHEKEIENFKIQKQQFNHNDQNSKQFLKQSDQLETELSRQKNINQQIQNSSYEQSSQIDLDQHQQFLFPEHNVNKNLENSFVEGVIPLNKMKPSHTGSEVDTTTKPHTFWKRIGKKLSNSYGKAKERAKTIFG